MVAKPPIGRRTMSRNLILPILLLASACAPSINFDPPAPDLLADRFELVAFYDEASGDELPLRRWERPIRIQIGQADAQPHLAAAGEVISVLDRLTPMPVRWRQGDEFANMLVLIGSWEEMEALWRRFPELAVGRDPELRFDCMVSAYPAAGRQPYAIGSAVVLIDSVNLDAAHIRRCLAQEITQALGLMNDIDDPDGTVFSSLTRRETLSRSDENMVRILYDPRLETGMSRAEAMPIVRRIAAELEPAPLIN